VEPLEDAGVRVERLQDLVAILAPHVQERAADALGLQAPKPVRIGRRAGDDDLDAVRIAALLSGSRPCRSNASRNGAIRSRMEERAVIGIQSSPQRAMASNVRGPIPPTMTGGPPGCAGLG
jgi:hypothetical protein